MLARKLGILTDPNTMTIEMSSPQTEAVVQRCFVNKVFLEISQNSQENTCVRVSLLIKLQASNFIKKETLAQVFPVKFAEFLRTPFLQNTSSGCF